LSSWAVRLRLDSGGRCRDCIHHHLGGQPFGIGEKDGDDRAKRVVDLDTHIVTRRVAAGFLFPCVTYRVPSQHDAERGRIVAHAVVVGHQPDPALDSESFYLAFPTALLRPLEPADDAPPPHAPVSAFLRALAKARSLARKD